MKIFLEEQKFTQLWLHILLIISFIVAAAIIVMDYKVATTNTNLVEPIIAFGTMLLVYLLIFSLKLKTRIDENGIEFRFIPFHFSERSIHWNEIERVYTRKYDAITEYGGWGMKGGMFWRKSKGVAYNVKGDIGLQLELKNGKKILIGTQKEDEMKRALQTYSGKITNHED
jgi:hypothetical protein